MVMLPVSAAKAGTARASVMARASKTVKSFLIVFIVRILSDLK